MEPFLRVPNNSMVTLTEGITTTTNLSTHPSINTDKDNNSTNLKSILVSASTTETPHHNERHVQFDLAGLAQQLHSRLPRYPKRPFWRNKKQDVLDEALLIKDFRYKIEQSQREIDEEFPGWVKIDDQQFNFTVLKRTSHCSSDQPSEEFRDVARGFHIGRKTVEQVLAEKPTIPTKLKKVDFRKAMREFNKRFGLPQEDANDDNDDAFSFVESSDPANIDLDLEIIDFDDVVYVDARETVEEEQEESEQIGGEFEDVQTLKEEQGDEPNDSEGDYFQVVPPTQFELDQDEQFFQDMIVVVEENDPRFDPNYQSSESDSSDSSDGVKVVADFHVVYNN